MPVPFEESPFAFRKIDEEHPTPSALPTKDDRNKDKKKKEKPELDSFGRPKKPKKDV